MSKPQLRHIVKFKDQIMGAIQEYPLIQHNQLLHHLVEHKRHMAKKTAEKYLRELIDEKKIFEYKEGKIKKYELSSSIGLSEKLLKKQFDKWISEIKNSIKKMEKNYPKYNTYMKINTPDHLKSLYESLQNVHYAHENPEKYSYEDLGTQENILCNEIIEATKGTEDSSITEQRHKAITLRDEIRRLKKEDNIILKKLKHGITKSSERENVRAASNDISKKITTAFLSLEKIHEELV